MCVKLINTYSAIVKYKSMLYNTMFLFKSKFTRVYYKFKQSCI